MQLVGRLVSASLDTATVLLVYLTARRLAPGDGDHRLGLGAAAFYALCVLPIQLSHFYAVDTLLTFFASLTLYACLRLGPGAVRWTALAGVALGCALATKTSALLLAVPVAAALLVLPLLGGPQEPGRVRWIRLGAASVLAALAFVLAQPYALIEVAGALSDPGSSLSDTDFLRHQLEQGAMIRDASRLPYTLQYLGTLPYLYPLEHLVRFGMGWALGLAALLGTAITAVQAAHALASRRLRPMRSGLRLDGLLLLLIYFVSYFLVVGGAAVKFMRYLLPLYPVLCVLAATGLHAVFPQRSSGSARVFHAACLVVALSSLGWSVAFLGIYSEPNTRLRASVWMHEQLPAGSSLAIEHWDDALPVPPWNEGFDQVSLPLYDPDTPAKWRSIAEDLERVDAIVLASHRLYSPLMRLEERFPLASRYYRLLFSGDLGFVRSAEFVTRPGLGPLRVDDQQADESFTVYDHPKVMVFIKQRPLSRLEYFDRIAGGTSVRFPSNPHDAGAR
jgi:4-amino-4-deoxy-L-arabinose transferase-like glycosyltransferase